MIKRTEHLLYIRTYSAHIGIYETISAPPLEGLEISQGENL